jgi:hypothetical protein
MGSQKGCQLIRGADMGSTFVRIAELIRHLRSLIAVRSSLFGDDVTSPLPELMKVL